MELAALEAHLLQQLDSTQALQTILDDQLAAIKANDPGAIMNTVLRFQTEMARRQRLDAARDQLLSAAAQHLGIDARDVTLELVLQGAPEARAEQLREISKALRDRMAALQVSHTTNRDLIRTNLAFVDQMIGALDGPDRNKPGYGDNASSAPTSSRPILDLRG